MLNVQKKQSVNLELPFPPSVNHYWIRRGNQRLAISHKGKVFRQKVRVAKLQNQSPTLLGRLGLEVTLYPPDRRKRDIDNYLKALLDAMEKAEVYDNDEQIDVLHVYRGVTESKDGHSVVKVWTL